MHGKKRIVSLRPGSLDPGTEPALSESLDRDQQF